MEDSTRKAYLVKIGQELAWFALLNKVGTCSDTQWNMSEFFILAKFQGQGLGIQVANLLWKMHPGLWEVSVIPENKKALAFWRKAISNFVNGKYKEELKFIAEKKARRYLKF